MEEITQMPEPGQESLSHRLSEWIVNLTYDDLPPAVVDHTRTLTLDTLGVALAGAGAPGSREIEEAVSGTDARCRTWATGKPLDAANAAFVNSVHAAALDYDSVFERGSVHPDIVSVPAAWSLCEQTGSSGKAFIVAVAAANEIMCRLASAAGDNPGWFNTALYGGFGAAAAAAKVLSLDVAQTRDAIGLAFSQSGGSQQALIEKTMAKRVQSGFAARAGVFSAQLAAAGVTAPAECFEGDFGFYRLYNDGDGAAVIDGLGDDYLCTTTAVKKYPSCTANHVPVDLAIDIVRDLDLSPDDVQSVEATISPFADRLVGAPFDPGDNPQVAAQFSIEYSLACAVLRRRLTVEDIQEDAVRAPDIPALIDRISVVVDDGNAGKFAPADVAVTTRTHGTVRRRGDNVPGTRENPLSADQVEQKFRDCAAVSSVGLTAAGIDGVIGGAQMLANVGNMADFFEAAGVRR